MHFSVTVGAGSCATTLTVRICSIMLRPGLDFEIPTVEILEKYLEATWESEGLGLKRKESVFFFFC